MMLRSSSTPLLGSLLSSVSESPNHQYHHSELHRPSPVQNCSRLSCSSNGGTPSYTSRSMRACSSPSVEKIKTQSGLGLRRVQSEGNMENLAMDSYNIDEFSLQKRFGRKQNCSSLDPILSFTHHKLETSFEDFYESDDDEEEEGEEVENEVYASSIRAENMVLEQMKMQLSDYKSWGSESEGMLHMASGPGVSRISLVDNGGNGGGSGGGSSPPVAFDRGGGGGDNRDLGVEEHYKKMLAENPGNALVLRNYAQFLYQKKGDLPGAEVYYSRAILADPEDGEIMSQYAKLIWDLHHDKERATNYFERAVQASSEDSQVHAAYASFLWNIEDDEDGEENTPNNSHNGKPLIRHGIMASATA